MGEDRCEQAGGTVPFQVLCEGCGARINDPDTLFELGACAAVPDSECLLLEVRCLSCGTATDACLWLGDRSYVLSEAAGPGFLTELESPEGRAVLDRFYALVTEYRGAFDPLGLEPGRQRPPSLGAARVEFRPPAGELPAFPARVLAAARGMRQAAEAYPAPKAPMGLRLGRFTCVLSVDHEPAVPHPWLLHLSVSNSAGPEPPSNLEQWGLATLFFTSREAPYVWRGPGLTAPIIHFRLGVWPTTGRVRIANGLWLQPDARRVLVFSLASDGPGDVPGVSCIERAGVRDFLGVLGGEAEEAATGDGALRIRRSGDGVELRIRRVIDLAGEEVVWPGGEGVRVFRRLLDRVAVSPGMPDEAGGPITSDETSVLPWSPLEVQDLKLALWAAYMLKAMARLKRRAEGEEDGIGSVGVENELETFMRPGWERRLGPIRQALGEATGELARALASRWLKGALVSVSCREFLSTHGPAFRVWSLLVGKHLLPVLQRALKAEGPGLSVSYRLGRFYVQDAASWA